MNGFFAYFTLPSPRLVPLPESMQTELTRSPIAPGGLHMTKAHNRPGPGNWTSGFE